MGYQGVHYASENNVPRNPLQSHIIPVHRFAFYSSAQMERVEPIACLAPSGYHTIPWPQPGRSRPSSISKTVCSKPALRRNQMQRRKRQSRDSARSAVHTTRRQINRVVMCLGVPRGPSRRVVCLEASSEA